MSVAVGPPCHRCGILPGFGLFAFLVFAPPLNAETARAMIVQTNSAGDSVSIIDPRPTGW
jgi:hypothetical protein